MAGEVARRSARARTSQSQSQHSSTTSSSGRAERSTRGFIKTGSPQKSMGSGSLSSEPPEELTPASNDDTTLHRRRSTRGKEVTNEDMTATGDDNEIVRCVCGFEEWPGPVQSDDAEEFGLKLYGLKEDSELAGFFLQCDVCKVWQHGLCVSIITEESAPDDYYCEGCRADLHEVKVSNGQRYSLYLPVHRPSRSTSRATSAAKDGRPRSPRGERKTSRESAAAESASSKRRSTMNSRDAAYDEEEQLRRAIEASKEDAIVEDSEPSARRPKRGRDDDEVQIESIKRQRTGSTSPSPFEDQVPMASREDSEDDSGLRNGNTKKSARNAVRTQRERAERDERREEQERKRAEAANKRKGRAERRRADESDPSEEMPLAARAVVNRTTESAQPPDRLASSQPAPDTPPADKVTASSHKKKPGTQHKKGKGRNQYTKDRDIQEHDNAPPRSMSRDVPRNADESGTAHAKSSAHESVAKHNSKARGGMNSKVTMTDMKRRANNILEFITRTQVELAGEPLFEKNSPRQSGLDDVMTRNVPPSQLNGSNGGKEPRAIGNGITSPIVVASLVSLRDFKELNCVEMMDALTRELVKWQQEYAP